MKRLVVSVFALVWVVTATRGEDASWEGLAKEYEATIRPLMTTYCDGCHSGDLVEANVDFSLYPTLAAIRKEPNPWRHVADVLRSGEMPPVEETQPGEMERDALKDWVRRYLALEAKEYAGDPGPSVLRRLTNAEYTYVARDLTGVAELNPAREFPVDGAAGEGFTNAAVGLAMSPALVGKYLDAGKEVARHAVLLPGGISFSPMTTRRDWSEEYLAEIRALYAKYSAGNEGSSVNLQGIVFDTNAGGRLPTEAYFAALLEERANILAKRTTVEEVASARKLSSKYLRSLKELLEKPVNGERPSLLLDPLREAWKLAEPKDAGRLVEMVTRHQGSLWRFTSVGHIGKAGGPTAWMEPTDPIAERFEARLKLTGEPGQDVVLYLVTGDAGDGARGDMALWERPRLVAPGRPDVLLKDLRALVGLIERRKREVMGSTAACLEAAAEAERAGEGVNAPELAAKHQVPEAALVGWLDYLGLGKGTPARIDQLLTRTTVNTSGYDFVRGWVGDDALSVVANSSDQSVRIPGNMAAHGVAVHPSPSRQVAIGWRSPVAEELTISGMAQHAHPECGNGVEWSLELRRGHARQLLAGGVAHGPTRNEIGPVAKIAVQPGDLVSLVIRPREQNHSCDLTAIDLTLKSATTEWNLAREVSPDLLAGNPHADGHGHAGVWHFYSEPTGGASEHVVPAGSLLARWQRTSDVGERSKLAREIAALLASGAKDLPADHADKRLYGQLLSLDGPLLGSALRELNDTTPEGESSYGLERARFGKDVDGGVVEGASLCARAPSVVELRLPAELVTGSEFVTTGLLLAGADEEGSVQFQVTTEKPTEVAGLRPSDAREETRNVPWTSNGKLLTHQTPIVVKKGSKGETRIRESLAEFRAWFPAALCYTKIVPVDEVVTLTLFYREDEPLCRLMLDDEEKERLERAWANLHFVSQDALTLVDAYEQLMQYATQDADPKVFEPMRGPIMARAEAFRAELRAAEPKHLASVKEFAARAYRRRLNDEEGKEFDELYRTLRERELDHESAIRLMLARVLVAPTFLYRVEQGSGEALGAKTFSEYRVERVTDEELAARLGFFLWSSVPDDRLRGLATTGQLRDEKVLLGEAARMLEDPKARRLATEFACQWIHVYGFDEHNEKSAEAYPTFESLRGAMYEETIRFFMDLFARDGSLLTVLDGDATYLNEALAKHYGIENVTGPEWRRVEGLRGLGRGGVLGMGSTLAKQSGASRTSPILRGNWVSEVLLGDKLPKPPKGVPPLPETVPAGLTERQLIERHSTEPSCMTCHVRIDPLGFALEGFDGIGRTRVTGGEKKYDTKTTLADGTAIEGLAGLSEYMITKRRADFVKHFCRKLLGYALGRETVLGDQGLLEEMERRLAANDYRVRSALVAILQSPQFQGVRISREKVGISGGKSGSERLRRVAASP